MVTLRDGTIVANAIDFSGFTPNPVTLMLYAPAYLYDSAAITGTMRRVIPNTNGITGYYTVDWVNQIIVVNNGPLITGGSLLTSNIDIVLYEFGNGNQLVRSNTTTYAMSQVVTPINHTEILLDVPYESGTFTMNGITYNVMGVTEPSADANNWWQTVAVFANGERLMPSQFPGVLGVTFPSTTFTIQPQRTYDPVNDPYNPAKIVFTDSYDPLVDYVSFVVSSDYAGISGVSVPETQWFTGKVGPSVNLDLGAFLGDQNIENIIFEIDGQRYDGSAPTTVSWTTLAGVLAYPAPVYGLSDFATSKLTVTVNGVTVPSSTGTWLANYDPATKKIAAIDADFGLNYGFFDDGTQFDNVTTLAVVFEATYLSTIVGQNITISYDAASVPEAFTITYDALNPVGGQMTVNVPVQANQVISVTTFNRTTQQSLVTQTITDATVSAIVGIVENYGIPVTLTTADYHNLELRDYVGINGQAAPDLDGNKYYVYPIDQYTVQLYLDYNLTQPVLLTNSAPLIPLRSSFIQIINVNDTPLPATNPFSIDQPQFNLFDENRLWVTIVRTGTVPELRDYVSPDNLLIENNTLVILSEIQPSDLIILTSMVPTASPDETRFRISLDKNNGGTNASPWGDQPWDIGGWSYTNSTLHIPNVYQENQQTRTYLTETLNTSLQPSDQIVVADPRRIVEISKFNGKVIVNSGPENYINISGITSAIVTSVTAVIANTATVVDDYVVRVINNNTIRLVFTSSPAGLSLDITVAQGNTVRIQAEQIAFAAIDLTTGVISGLRRGQNGTIVNTSLDAGSQVQGVSYQDELNPNYYVLDWYGALNQTIPLQFTDSQPANFLNTTV
jgi:hypothetical protein